MRDFYEMMYWVIFIVQIVLLKKSIRKQEKKYWISLFLIEIIPIMVGSWFFFYGLPGITYSNSDMFSGLTALGDGLYLTGALIIYFIMLFITVCARVIIFEKNEKRNQRVSKNPILLILAITLISIEIFSIIYVIYDNFYMRTTTGTVVEIEDVENYYALIQYEVDGEEYQGKRYVDDTVNIGDEIKVAYNYKSKSLGYIITEQPILCLPLFIIGLLLLFIRFKGRIKKRK